jgi:hypothetical protein
MATKDAIALDDQVYESAKACSAVLGQSMTEWLNNAARAAARRQNACAYLAWEAGADRTGLDKLDEATASVSFDSTAW